MPELKYTGRQWDAILHPDCPVVNDDGWRYKDGVHYMTTPITEDDYNRRYNVSTVCQFKAAPHVDLATLKPGTVVEFETLSEHIYRFVCKGTTDNDAEGIVDVVGGLDMRTIVEEDTLCGGRLVVGSRFVLGTKYTSLVVAILSRH